MISRRDFIQQTLFTAMGLGVGRVFEIKKPNETSDNERNKRKTSSKIHRLESGFLSPPDSARPGVYWYFMDGNLSKKGMTADLESMKEAGINNVIFLEVNVGIPRGPVDFLSDEWLSLFNHAVKECERLNIRMTLGVGPGWTGSGGPWVHPEESMQHLVSSTFEISGPGDKEIQLPLPKPKKPYFGKDIFTPDLKEQWKNFYEDVTVLAFPTPEIKRKIKNIDNKALYYRAPYTSTPGVKPFLPSEDNYPDLRPEASISKRQIVELTDKLQADGTLNWEVPEGEWTIMRFGRCNNGAITRPAPKQGLGFECDKFDLSALNDHLDAYIGKIFDKIGEIDSEVFGGLKMLHMDSWEMGAQNWTPRLREEFIKRRGYDPLPFYPVYAGNVVESLELSERFLWDLRLTSQELVLDYHAKQIKTYSHRHGLELSIEPYDMNPTADLELGTIADIPMCEFWSKGFGFNSTFSCIEATSIAHVKNQPIVQAEAFTANGDEAWKQYPGSMKEQGDWAFAAGINRFFYHTFEHKPLDDSLRPGMTMGPYGVHWDRKQTWWSMADGYHQYVSRCQFMLQQGRAVSDILYLTPEGAPQVFVPPSSALEGDTFLPDRRGYNFDGCSPGQLKNANVIDGKIEFPSGVSYQILVLPAIDTMTPDLLKKVQLLISDGAVVVGTPPRKSPGLSGFPECDQKVKAISKDLWGDFDSPELQSEQIYGKGKIIWGGALNIIKQENLYPEYNLTAGLLKEMGVKPDFESSGPVRYTHRTTEDWDIYFVANRINQSIETDCKFRSTKGRPELWDPLTAETRSLPEFSAEDRRTSVPLKFQPYQSYFIIFAKNGSRTISKGTNFPERSAIMTLKGSWSVAFDPQWGGPQKIIFDKLVDWISRPEEGIKYYSGTAVYKKSFDLSLNEIEANNKRLSLCLGEVKNMARIHLNDHNLGVVWTAPWSVDITDYVKRKENTLRIEVANLWPNRLIGDEKFPDDTIKNGEWPEWLINGERRPGKRYSFATYQPYNSDSPLLESGLLGPVTIQVLKF